MNLSTSSSAKSADGKESGFVDVHGRDIRVVICEKTGEILIPLEEVRQTGFTIFRKSQYNKLLIDDQIFGNEFSLHLLAAAKTYIVDNRHAFNENEILQSIDNCKRILLTTKNGPHQNSFLKDRHIQETSDDMIRISKDVEKFRKTPPKETQQLTVQNVHTHNQYNSPDKSSFLNGKKPNDNYGRKSFDTSSANSFNHQSKTSNHKKDYGNQQAFNDKTEEAGPTKVPQLNLQKSSNMLRYPRSNPSDLLPNNNQDNSKGMLGNSPRPPRENSNSIGSGPPPRIKSFNLSVNFVFQTEYEVMVSYVETKPTCIWVQDKRDINLLADIFQKVLAEQETQKSIKINASMINKIYMAQDESLWFRCRVISANPPKVFFVDYGNVIEVDEVKPISDSLAQMPFQAIRLAVPETEHKPTAEDELLIKPFRQFDDGTFMVNVVKVIKDESSEPISSSTPKPEPRIFTQLPRILETLSDGLVVLIINENQGKLTMRSRNSSMKLKQIEGELACTGKPLQNVQSGQLVIYKKQVDDRLYRAVVKHVTNKEVLVDCFDYDSEEVVSLGCLYNITERLSLEPIACFKSPIMKGFGDRKVADACREFIREAITKKTKFSAVLNGGNFDLRTADGHLVSEILMKQSEPDDRIMFKDMKLFTPQLHTENLYLCYSFKSLNEVTIISEDDECIAHLEKVMRPEDPGDAPYYPTKGEVCFGIAQADDASCWYRCKIMQRNGDKYEVFFFDFGNSESLRPDQLRKLTDDVKNIPILGLPCRFVGIKHNKDAEEALRANINDGDDFSVLIKGRADDKFEIVIPTLYKSLNLNV